MEDAHLVEAQITGLENHAIYGVFDGHGGDKAAKFAASRLVSILQQTAKFQEYVKAGANNPELLGQALQDAFLVVDKEMKDQFDQVAAQERAEKGMDGSTANPNSLATLTGGPGIPDRSGCTAIVSVVTPTHIVVANAGDSRGIMSVGGETVALSDDHKPCNPGEQARIEAAGGTVAMKRVDGELAVSRALGDFQYKDDDLDPKLCKVTGFPDILIRSRSESDEFILLACDGIWDVYSNEDARSEINNFMAQGESSCLVMAQELLHASLNKSSRDNMSVIVVLFPGGAKLVDKTGAGIGYLRARREEDARQREELEKHES